MTNRAEQGTGKHAHKDSQEPWPHHDKGGSQSSEAESGGRHEAESGGQGGERSREAQGGDGESLKQREYRDSQGNVHHHTKTYEEQHRSK